MKLRPINKLRVDKPVHCLGTCWFKKLSPATTFNDIVHSCQCDINPILIQYFPCHQIEFSHHFKSDLIHFTYPRRVTLNIDKTLYMNMMKLKHMQRLGQ